MLKNDQEIKVWEKVDWRYMTEETDSDSGTNALCYKLSWRSDGNPYAIAKC